MKKILCCLLVLGLLLSTSGALAQTVTTEVMKMNNGTTVVLHHDENVEIVIDDEAPGFSGFWTVTDNVHAPVILGICLSEIHSDLSLADLTEEEQAQYAELIGFMFENPIIHMDTTPSGNLYLHMCSNEAHDVDSIFTIYKGAIVELIQHSLDDFGPLTEEDKKFCFNVLYGIEFITE